MILIEFDLAGAEWVVVAYLSQDSNMLGVVASGKSPHVVTGALISGASEEFVELENKMVGNHTDASTIEALRAKIEIPPGIFLPRVMSIRQAGKKSNHGLNYNMKFRRFALENEMLEMDAKPICDAYVNQAYPGIKDYWSDVRQELKENNRTLTNCFGRKVKLRNEWGEELFNQAYSFKPQSTVVDSVNRAMILVYRDDSIEFRPCALGAQVHDSLQTQFPIPQTQGEWEALAAACEKVIEYMRPTLFYHQEFRLNCDMKIGINWGDMHTCKPTPESMQSALDAAYQRMSESPAGSEEAVEGALETEVQDPQPDLSTPPCPPEELSLDF